MIMIILERPSHRPAASAGAGKLVPVPADIYGLWLALLASGALLAGWGRHPIRQPGDLLLFAALAAIAGSQKLWLPESARRRVSIGYIFVMAGMLFLGVPEAMSIAAASGLAGSLLNVPERPSLRAALFNVSALILSAALAGVTLLFLVPDPRGPLTAAGIPPDLRRGQRLFSDEFGAGGGSRRSG